MALLAMHTDKFIGCISHSKLKENTNLAMLSIFLKDYRRVIWEQKSIFNRNTVEPDNSNRQGMELFELSWVSIYRGVTNSLDEYYYITILLYFITF